MATDTSQSYGRTAGDNRCYRGGTATKQKTDGEEARGGERYARAGKLVVDKELVRGNLRGGREGGPYPSVENVAHNPKKGTESSDCRAPVLGLVSQ